MNKQRGYFIALFLIFGIAFTIYSCEKDITLDLPESEASYVVEGYVEPGTHPYILLTKTLPYASSSSQETLGKLTVQNPIVIISDGNTVDTLEQINGLGSLFFISTKITGEAGKSYSLKIVLPNHASLAATTTIPLPVPLDSAAFRYFQNIDSTGYLWLKFTDPIQPTNYYRTFTRNKQHQFGTSRYSVFSDKFFNGNPYEYTLQSGRVTGDLTNDDDRVYNIGDTVEIKFCAMTKAGYEFWRQAESQAANAGNIFNNTATLPSNISGGIGIFEGYAPTYYKVIVGNP